MKPMIQTTLLLAPLLLSMETLRADVNAQDVDVSYRQSDLTSYIAASYPLWVHEQHPSAYVSYPLPSTGISPDDLALTALGGALEVPVGGLGPLGIISMGTMPGH